MREPVEQRRCHLGIPEYAPPFREAQVGCDDQTGALVELAYEVKQQSATRLAEWQIAELIQYH